MKLLSFQTIFDLPNKIIDIQKQRQRLLNIILICASLISTIIYPAAMNPVLDKQLYMVGGIYTAFYIWLLLITLFRRLPYMFRAVSWLFFLYVFGVINLGLSGLNIDAGLFLLSFIATTAFLFDFGWSLIALTVSISSIAAMGYIVIEKNLPLLIGLPQSDPQLWLIGGLLFYFLVSRLSVQ